MPRRGVGTAEAIAQLALEFLRAGRIGEHAGDAGTDADAVAARPRGDDPACFNPPMPEAAAA